MELEEDIYSSPPKLEVASTSASPTSALTTSSVTAMDVDDDPQSQKKRAQHPVSPTAPVAKKRVKQKQPPEAGVTGCLSV